MEIKEAIKNIEAELNCRKNDETMCVKYECGEGKGGCPFYVSGETLIESLQTFTEWCKCALAKEREGSENHDAD